jgi:hypothetical protein
MELAFPFHKEGKAKEGMFVGWPEGCEEGQEQKKER